MYTTKIPVLLTLICASSLVQGGYLGSQLAYSGGFPPQVPFVADNYLPAYGAPHPYAAPSPVAPYGAPHSFGVGYSSPPVVKFRSFGPFTTYASVRSHHKFAFPAPVPSFYNAPHPGVSYAAPPAVYNDYPSGNAVVKFGPPITTTTTTYSTTAHAAAPIAVANSAVAGW
ncbi:hypothetical protein DOY81_008728 [Sarcophaga bullata]|nr:hypothetical protein DOY81_008728 [Sarcophaga bullata]